MYKLIDEKLAASKEALSLLKQTVAQIKNLNSSMKHKFDSALLAMSSEDIAEALLGKINPNQFTKSDNSEI